MCQMIDLNQIFVQSWKSLRLETLLCQFDAFSVGCFSWADLTLKFFQVAKVWKLPIIVVFQTKIFFQSSIYTFSCGDLVLFVSESIEQNYSIPLAKLYYILRFNAEIWKGVAIHLLTAINTSLRHYGHV